MTLFIFNFKKLLPWCLSGLFLLLHSSLKDSKSQSVIGDLRVAVKRAGFLKGTNVDTLYLGTSIFHRVFHDSKRKVIAFPGHTVIDATKFASKNYITSRYYLIEGNLIDSKEGDLLLVEELLNQYKFNVEQRLSDKLVGFVHQRYSANRVYTEKDTNEIITDDLDYDQIKFNLSRLGELGIVSEDIVFVFVPMSVEKVNEFHVLEKSEYLRSLGYKVFVPEVLFMSTTDGVHLTTESAQNVVNNINFKK